MRRGDRAAVGDAAGRGPVAEDSDVSEVNACAACGDDLAPGAIDDAAEETSGLMKTPL